MVNSRLKKKDNRVWRRRRCAACGATFSTAETAQLGLAWQVRDGSHLKPFSRDKLFMSLYGSCQHRKTALEDARGLTDTITGKLSDYINDGVIGKSDLVQVVQVALNRFDKAASVHYAAYRQAD